MFVGKQFDIVIGVDIHIIQPPGPVPPVPIPHPFVGMVFDPMEFVPIIGASILVNGIPRAQAGTTVMSTVPHIPIGGVFVKPPSNDGEIFMGSMTVNSEGEPFPYLGTPVLTCQDAGMLSVPRPKRKSKSKPKSLVLPLSTLIPVPKGGENIATGLLTISMAILGTIALGGALKKLIANRAANRAAVKSNYKRFLKKIPSNSKSSANMKKLKGGNYLFEAISPGKVPGSKAVYQKWVNKQGETFKMIKTTFGPDGNVIHVKPKF